MANGAAISPASTRRRASDARHPDRRAAHPLSRDRALSRPAGSTSATATASIGSAAARRAASRWSSSTAAPAPAAAPTIAASSIPARYDIFLFDQRGCGRSTPHASLEANTTWHLVDDIERLREHGRASSAGWCSAAPGARRSRSLMPRPIPSASPSWCCAASSPSARPSSTGSTSTAPPRSIPDKWEEFLAPIPEAERGDLVAAYHRRLTGDDPAVQLAAAKAWSKWEAETVTLLPNPRRDRGAYQRRFRDRHRPDRESLHGQQGLARGRPAARQCRHGCKDIPGVIVQGRYDCCTPPAAAWDLHSRPGPRPSSTSSPTAAICSTSPASSTA